MSIPFRLADSGLHRDRAHLSSNVIVLVQRITLLIKVIIGVYLCLTLIIFGVLSIARSGTIPELYDPPLAYLPGNPLLLLPKDVARAQYEYRYVSSRYVSSRTNSFGRELYLSYEPISRMIVRTTIHSDEHKIGDLVAAWGSPKGFFQHGDYINISWGTRAAILITASFRPDSRVTFIEYDFEQPQVSPWQGFVSSKPVEK